MFKCPECKQTLPFVLLDGKNLDAVEYAVLRPLTFQATINEDDTIGDVTVEANTPEQTAYWQSIGGDSWLDVIQYVLQEEETDVNCPYCDFLITMHNKDDDEIEVEDVEWGGLDDLDVSGAFSDDFITCDKCHVTYSDVAFAKHPCIGGKPRARQALTNAVELPDKW